MCSFEELLFFQNDRNPVLTLQNKGIVCSNEKRHVSAGRSQTKTEGTCLLRAPISSFISTEDFDKCLWQAARKNQLSHSLGLATSLKNKKGASRLEKLHWPIISYHYSSKCIVITTLCKMVPGCVPGGASVLPICLYPPIRGRG